MRSGTRVTRSMVKHVFLTGPPGVGKTTLIQKACESLLSAGVAIDGFYTEEVREGGRRVGFDVVTLAGERASLSRIGTGLSAGRHQPKVGQYLVDIASFETLVLPLFRKAGTHSLFVVDEIGKMELFSQSFIRVVRQALSSSSLCLLGTIPVPRGKALALVEEVRSRQDIKIFTVTKDNREHILTDIVAAVQESLRRSA